MAISKKTFVINGDNFSDLSGFYDEVQGVLTEHFEGFGRNLDAFNDILRGGFGRFDYGENIQIVWKNSIKSKMDLGFAETIKYYTKQLTRVHPSNLKYTREQLKQAKKKQGQTLFDILVEIIKDSHNVEFEFT